MNACELCQCVCAGEKNRLGDPPHQKNPQKTTKPLNSCGPFLQLFFYSFSILYSIIYLLFSCFGEGNGEEVHVCVSLAQELRGNRMVRGLYNCEVTEIFPKTVMVENSSLVRNN